MNILNISIGMVGLASSLTGLNALTSSALQAYAASENLVSSLDALVAKQIAIAKDMEITEARKKSTAVTKELVDWTMKLGIQSPFSQEGIANSFKMAMSFGMNIQMAKQATAALIDFTAATGQSAYVMEGAMMAMGQAFSKGKLQGEEALQLIERGVPVWEYLRRATGKTNAELQDMSSKGLISAKQAMDALVQGMNEDFGGAAASSQYSINGLLSSFGDLATVAKTTVFTPAILAFTPTLIRASDTLGSLETLEKMKRAGLALIETGEKITPVFQTTGEILKSVTSYAVSLKDNLRYLPGDFLSAIHEMKEMLDETSGVLLRPFSEIASTTNPLIENALQFAFPYKYLPGDFLDVGPSVTHEIKGMLDETPGVLKGTFSEIASTIKSNQPLIENALQFAFTYKVTKFFLPLIPATLHFFKNLPVIGLSAFYNGVEKFFLSTSRGIGEKFKNAVLFDLRRNFVQQPAFAFFKTLARTWLGTFQDTLAQEQGNFRAFLTRWVHSIGNPVQSIVSHATLIGGAFGRLGQDSFKFLVPSLNTFFNDFDANRHRGIGSALQLAFNNAADQVNSTRLQRRTRVAGQRVTVAFRDEMSKLVDYSKNTFTRVAKTFAMQQFVMPTFWTALPLAIGFATMKWAEYREEVENVKQAMMEASPWFERVNDSLTIAQELDTEKKWTEREYRNLNYIDQKELAQLERQKQELLASGASPEDIEVVQVVTRITQIEEEIQLRSDHLEFLDDAEKQREAYARMINRNEGREKEISDEVSELLITNVTITGSPGENSLGFSKEGIDKLIEQGTFWATIENEVIPDLEKQAADLEAKARTMPTKRGYNFMMDTAEGLRKRAATLKDSQREVEAIGKSQEVLGDQMDRVDAETTEYDKTLSINLENTEKAAEAAKDYAKVLEDIAKAGKGLGDSLAGIERDIKIELKEAGKGKKIEELEEIKELEKEYNEDVSERIAQYNKDRADAKEQFHKDELKRIKDFQRSEEEAEAQHTEAMIQMAMGRLQELDDMAEDMKPQTQSALDALASTEADFHKDAEKRLEDWNKKRQLLAEQGAMCKLPEERKAFEEQERQAAEAYMKQEQQQRAALGRQLIDFTIAMALRNDVSAQAMEEMVTGIAKSTGAYDSVTSDILGKTFSGIASWAKSGGQGAEAVLANIRELPRAAREAKVAEDELASSMREQAVANYLRTGDLETYQRELNEIPKKVSQSLTDQSIENVWESSKAWESQQAYQRKVEDAETQYQKERQDAHKNHLQLMAEEEQKHKDNLLEIDAQYTEDMNELWEDYQEEEAKRVKDHQDELTRIEGEGRDKRIEDAMRAADREAAIEIAKIDDIEKRQKAVNDYMDYAASQQQQMVWLDTELDKIDYSSEDAVAQRKAAILSYAREVNPFPSLAEQSALLLRDQYTPPQPSQVTLLNQPEGRISIPHHLDVDAGGVVDLSEHPSDFYREYYYQDTKKKQPKGADQFVLHNTTYLSVDGEVIGRIVTRQVNGEIEKIYQEAEFEETHTP